MSYADYVLTTFSPAMFGEKATCHIKIISQDDARELISSKTKVVATRVTHDRLARQQLPGADPETARYANLKAGVRAISMHYRGPHINDNGDLPLGGQCTFYLIDAEDYYED